MNLQFRIAIFAILTAGLVANRANASLTLYPDYAGASNVAANGTTSAPGFATSSWQQSSNTKGELYIPASALFAAAVKISDIASISFWTNKSTTAADPDWSLILYTATTGSGDSASWYHSRLNSEPYLTGTASVTPGTWHEWSTGDATDPLRFYDSNRNGGVFGTYTDPTLADLKAGPIAWPTSGSSVDYSNEVVNLFSLQTGSAWANGFTGLVDGLTVTLTNGDFASVNLEAVPEPSSVVVWSLLGLVVGTAAWRRKRNSSRR